MAVKIKYTKLLQTLLRGLLKNLKKWLLEYRCILECIRCTVQKKLPKNLSFLGNRWMVDGVTMYLLRFQTLDRIGQRRPNRLITYRRKRNDEGNDTRSDKIPPFDGRSIHKIIEPLLH